MATTTLALRDRTASLYGPTLVLALLAMTPGLINFSALDIARPTIGGDLGISSAEASWATLLGNAALPLGVLVAAGLLRQVSPRRLTFTGLGMLIIGAVCSALSANLPMLILAHTVQGFAYGLVICAASITLMTVSTPDRLPITVTVLGLGLFGGVTLGPMIGGVVEHADAWRGFLIMEAILALAALVPAWAVLPRSLLPQKSSISSTTVLLAGGGLLALFIGVAELSWYHWTRPQVEAPLALGAVTLLALTIGEWARGGALATLKVAAAANVCAVAAFGFGGLLALLLEFLQQVRGLGAQDAGNLLWPAPVTAFLALVWAGVVFSRPRWITSLAATGVLLLAVAAWQLANFTEYTGDSSVMLLAALLGLGAGLSIGPTMLLVALNESEELWGRAVALVTFTPYVLLAASGPLLTYVSTVRQTVHYTNLQWEQGWTQAVGASGFTGPTAQALQTRALMLGINDAAIVVVVAFVLVVAVATVLTRFRTRSGLGKFGSV